MKYSTTSENIKKSYNYYLLIEIEIFPYTPYKKSAEINHIVRNTLECSFTCFY